MSEDELLILRMRGVYAERILDIPNMVRDMKDRYRYAHMTYHSDWRKAAFEACQDHVFAEIDRRAEEVRLEWERIAQGDHPDMLSLARPLEPSTDDEDSKDPDSVS
jgi:hypothetical protein